MSVYIPTLDNTGSYYEGTVPAGTVDATFAFRTAHVTWVKAFELDLWNNYMKKYALGDCYYE